jgi:hypothetical protein
MLPTFSPIRPQWRGNTSSADMNTNFEQIIYDLNSIFQEASNLVITLNNLESRMRHDTDAVSAQLTALSGVFSSYEQTQATGKVFYEDFFSPEHTAYPNTVTDKDKCKIDTEYGVATLPINSSFSKVYTTNITNGSVVIAPDLIVDVTPTDEAGNLRVDQTSPKTAFDGDVSTVWERKVRFDRDSARSNVSCIMTITLPSMSNPYVNRLRIKPYPEGREDVQLVTYDTASTQNNVIPTFPVGGVNNLTSTFYSFENIQPTNIKIYFRSRFNEIDDNMKTFIYGAREIGVEKAEYLATGRVGMKFTVPSWETGLLNEITSIQTNPAFDDIIYLVSIYASEGDFNSDLPIWTSSSSEITVSNPLSVIGYGTDSIWVMITIVQPNGNTSTPILKNVSMTYTTA